MVASLFSVGVFCTKIFLNSLNVMRAYIRLVAWIKQLYACALKFFRTDFRSFQFSENQFHRLRDKKSFRRKCLVI